MSHGLRKQLFALTLQAGLLFPAVGLAAPQYPSPDVPWTERQYTDFYFTHFNTHLALPHLRTPESRALFERLTSRDNIDSIIATSATRQDKLLDLRIILATVGGIRGFYNLAVKIGEPLQEESTQVQIFHLYLIGVIADLAGENIADANCSPAMKTAWLGVVQSLAERDVYSPSQIEALSDAAARRYPVLRDLFPVGERALLRARIEALRATSEPRSSLALARLASTLKD